MERDPIGFGGGYTNLFGYCGSDPVNCIDPSGLIDLNIAHDIEGSSAAENANNIPTTTDSFSVAAHGSSTKNGSAFNKSGEIIDATDLAEIITSSSSYKYKSSVTLNICYAGRGGDESLGQQLANKLGIVVFAPTTALQAPKNGTVIPINGGHFEAFFPK